MRDEVFRAENLRGHYIRRNVLDGFYFSVDRGQTVGICGAAKSGKTTLMNLITGSLPGEWHKDIFIDGRRVNIRSSDDAMRSGLYCVYSSPSMLDGFTVAENLCIFDSNRMSDIRLTPAKINREAEEILRQCGIEGVDVTRRLSEYPTILKFLLEIVRAAKSHAKVIFLDCAQTLYNEENIDLLRRLLGKLGKQGICFVLLMNRVDERVIGLTDKLIIMREGIRIKELYANGYDYEWIRSLVNSGKQFGALSKESESEASDFSSNDRETVFSVKNLRISGKSVDFSVYGREILGMRIDSETDTDTVVQMFAGGHFNCDRMTFCGSAYSGNRLPSRMQSKIYVLPGLADEFLIFDNLSEEENLVIGARNLLAPPMYLVRKDVTNLVAAENSKLLDVLRENRAEGTQSHILNMQLAQVRMQLQKTRLMVISKPFVGLDEESEQKIMLILRNIASRGTSVILIDQDGDKFSAICDYVIAL